MASIFQKLGENVRRERRRQNLSQEALAAKAHLDLTSVSEIESGLRNPSVHTIHKIVLALRTRSSNILPF